MTDEHGRVNGRTPDLGSAAEPPPAWEPGAPVEATFGPAWSASWARASSDELDYWLAFAQAACDAADEIALRHFRRDIEVMTKPDRSFVTAADQAIERLIRERIATAFPDHGLVGEEYGTEAADAPIRWYIDPIDGTHNFIRGVPLFGTLLALEADGELQLGVVSAPALRERWYARRGGGAWAVGAAGSEGAAGDPRLPGRGARRRPGAVRLRARHRDVRARPRLPRAPRRGLARARVRRLLGLHAARRRRGRGDGRGRPVVVGPGRAARRGRGGRRPGHRLRGAPADRLGHASSPRTACSTTRSWPRCGADRGRERAPPQLAALAARA